MDLTTEQLEELLDLAAALMPIDEIAILLDILPQERAKFSVICRQSEGDPIYEAFHKGRLRTKLELRKNIIKLAKAGSPAAEPLAEKFIKEQMMQK